MTNAEKYKSAKERAEAFVEYCKSANSIACQHNGAFACSDCAFRWLDLEAPAEDPLPCPFCGGEMRPNIAPENWVTCKKCFYSSKEYNSIDAAIAAHNRVARAVAKEKDFNGESHN